MKFGKEFTSQMVQEWKEAYMDYHYLKSLLKEIQCSKLRERPPQSNKRRTLYRAFSGLIQTTKSPGDKASPDVENQAILVNSDDGGGSCETTFLMAAEEGGKYEVEYFRKLDEEFNKVVRFYRDKVGEVMEEAGVLTKQMDALIAFRIKVDNPQLGFDSAAEMSVLASDVAASTAALSASTPSGYRTSRIIPMDVIEEDGSIGTSQSNESIDDIEGIIPMDVIEEDGSIGTSQSNESIDDTEGTQAKPLNQNVKEKKRKSINGSKPAPLEILNHVTMNKPNETPRSTIKGFIFGPKHTQLRFNQGNLKKVEDQLKWAFIDFYDKLRLLKSYSFLNILAFSKIMKKYDKITSRSASKSYLKMVENSYLGSSNKITKLMERVEVTFTKHFFSSSRSGGMTILRPKAKNERHGVTFSLGFFVGCVLALILALVLIIRTHNTVAREGRIKYMQTLFPLYSLFGFIILHMLMYAANIYFWRRYRVNYPFIFGFKKATELGYREVLLLSFGFMVLAVTSVLANLDMDVDPITGDYRALTELVPLGLLVLVIAILLCPLNIIYRSSRFFLITCVFHCICAPLYKVSLSDFFLADQLTSQVQAFRSLEFYICYYGWGNYKVREHSCRTNDVFRTFYFIAAAIPYWLRLLQCLRRLYEEKNAEQGFNGLKYFSTIVAITSRTAFYLNRGTHWRIIAWIASVIAVIFGTYWDLVKDWGLLQWNSKNRWLRNKLLLPHKSIYFAAMVLNILLRLAWLETVLRVPVPLWHRETVIAVAATLEIIRRGIWNFFRLENEHLNNVGNYCAFKSVPLPFNYDEDENKDG